MPLTDLPVAGIARPGPGASRRNRYQIQAYRPLPELISSERTLGEVLTLLPGANAGALTGQWGSAGACLRAGCRPPGAAEAAFRAHQQPGDDVIRPVKTVV